MRCNICDRAMGESEIQLTPDNLSYEPCSVCMEIIMDTAYSDGFTRPQDDEFELDEDCEFEVTDEEFEVLEDNDSYRSYFDHCDISVPSYDPDGDSYD